MCAVAQSSHWPWPGSTSNVLLTLSSPLLSEVVSRDSQGGGQAEAGPNSRPDTPTYSQDGEEEHPEEPQEWGKNGLVDGGHVDLRVQFGGRVGVVHVIAVCDVLHTQIQQPWGPEDRAKVCWLL